MKEIEEIFDEKKIKKSVKKAKFKLIIKIVTICIIVFLVGGVLNWLMCFKFSNDAYEKNEVDVKLSIPNGYISEANDIFGFLGGQGTYKISKQIGDRSIILEDRTSSFGISFFKMCYRFCGSGYHNSGEWPVDFWENGYKKMRFFHPEIKYKEYQNDLEKIDNIPDGKIIEMAISFDKKYKIVNMPTMKNKYNFPEIKWIWLNEFTEEKMDEYKYKVNNYDAKANGIRESEVLGLEISHEIYGSYDNNYDELIENLKKSRYRYNNELYHEIMERGKTSVEDAEILGVIVQGTKEEMKKLINSPVIKATSIGIVTDPVY